MLKTRLICRFSALLITLVVLGIVASCSLAAMLVTAVKIEDLFVRLANEYDSHLPEIRIRDGQASVREKQPYFVDLGDQHTVVVVDTREGAQKEAMEHLKHASVGAVLTKDKLILKNQTQVRTISLKEMPDLEINSETISGFVRNYSPLVMRVATVLVILYYLAIKPLQIMIFALIPFFCARYFRVHLTYGESLKLAVAGMIPPVLLDLAFTIFETSISGGFIIYFVVYAGVMALICMDLLRDAPGPAKIQE